HERVKRSGSRCPLPDQFQGRRVDRAFAIGSGQVPRDPLAGRGPLRVRRLRGNKRGASITWKQKGRETKGTHRLLDPQSESHASLCLIVRCATCSNTKDRAILLYSSWIILHNPGETAAGRLLFQFRQPSLGESGLLPRFDGARQVRPRLPFGQPVLSKAAG